MNAALLISTAYTAIITVPVVWGFVGSLKNRNSNRQLFGLAPVAGFAVLELALILDWGTMLFVASREAPSLAERHHSLLSFIALAILICYVLGSAGVVLGRIMQLYDRAR